MSVIDKALISLALEGLSVYEIADVVGLTEPNVKVKVHRIKEQLKQLLINYILIYYENNYMLDPLRGLNDTNMELIQNEYYFTIHAPRQTGKTSLLRALMERINAEGSRISLYFSVETAGYRSITVSDANKTINRAIIQSAKSFLPIEYQPKNSGLAGEISFKDFVSQWTRELPKTLVLLIDVIDALYDDTLVSILRQLRDGFQLRPESFPSSVALVGLRVVREYKEKVRDNDKPIGSGSPFNVKAESLSISNFSKMPPRQLPLELSKKPRRT